MQDVRPCSLRCGQQAGTGFRLNEAGYSPARGSASCISLDDDKINAYTASVLVYFDISLGFAAIHSDRNYDRVLSFASALCIRRSFTSHKHALRHSMKTFASNILQPGRIRLLSLESVRERPVLCILMATIAVRQVKHYLCTVDMALCRTCLWCARVPRNIRLIRNRKGCGVIVL